MPIGAVSSRRPRSSVGQTQDFFSEGPSQHTVDVECKFTSILYDCCMLIAVRRKHSRQNKEIITCVSANRGFSEAQLTSTERMSATRQQ